MPNQTQEEFLKEFEPQQQTDVLTESLIPQDTVPPVVEGTKEDDGEKANRRERRLQVKLTAERESSIALAARLEALTEAQKFRSESEPAEYLKSVERIYGTNSPEATEATQLFKTALEGVRKQATQDALDAFREEQQKERDAVAKEEQSLDSMVEDIEDETGLDMDAPTKKGFYQLLEKLSPKDTDGNIIAYADHHAVWDELQARKTPQPNRAKDLAARSMVTTGASPKTSVETDANQRWLIENGII